MRCEKCGHTWITRYNRTPVACPCCKTYLRKFKPVEVKEEQSKAVESL